MIRLYKKYYKNHIDKFSVFFTSLLLSFAFLMIIRHHLPPFLNTATVLFSTAFIAFILYNLKPIRWMVIGLFIIFQALLLVSYMAYLPDFISSNIESLMPFTQQVENLLMSNGTQESYFQMIEWLIRSFAGKTVALETSYYWFVWLSFSFIVTALVLSIVEKRLPWYLFLSVSLYFIIGWFFYISALKFHFAIYVVALVIYQQFLTYEKLSLDREKGHRDYTQAFLVNIIVVVGVLAIASLVAFALPTTWINDKINVVSPGIDGLRSDFPAVKSGNTFSFSTTMYAPNGKLLGGPISERSYETIMRVDSEEGGLYLRGRVHNIYDGKRWTSDFTNYTLRSTSNDILEGIDSERITSIRIYPDRLNTRTLLSPYAFYESSYDDDEIFQNEQFIAYLKSATKGQFKPYRVYYVEDHLEELDDASRDLYLQLPPKGLPITRTLAGEVTQDAESDLDKMNALVSHLRENYRYSLEPDAYFGPKDFVERFISEEKVGYCTYFATSLAVMGRIVDVPTRYVEGYLTGYFKDSEGLYEVSANRAHAWVEAYIEGVGWQTFEATPAYEAPGERSFLDLPSGPEQEGPRDPDLPDRLEEPLEDFNLNTEDREFDLTQEEDQEKDERPWLIILLVLPLLMVSLLIVQIIKVKKRSVHEKLLIKIDKMSKVAYKVVPNSDYMWPKEVLITYGDYYLNLKYEEDFLRLIERVLYGSKISNQEDLERFDQYYKVFLKRVKKYGSLKSYLKLKI